MLSKLGKAGCCLLLLLGLTANSFATTYLIDEMTNSLNGKTTYGLALGDSGLVVGEAHDTTFTSSTAFIWSKSGGIVDLGALLPVAVNSAAVAVNDSDQVVGNYFDSTGSQIFLYQNGSLSSLGAGYARDINNSGHIVGGSLFYNGTTMIDLGGFNAAGLNDNDQIVGTLGGNIYLYDYTTNNMEDLGISGQVVDINNNGLILGQDWDMGGSHTFIYDYNTHIKTEIGSLGGSWTMPWAINNNGQVVGSSTAADGSMHGFLYDGTMTDVGTLIGGTSDGAWGLNDNGQLLVCYYDADDVHHPLLLTPVADAGIPEPATLILLGSGIIGLAGFRKRT